MDCPDCNEVIGEGSDFCLSCGLSLRKRLTSQWWLAVGLVALGLMITGSVYTLNLGFASQYGFIGLLLLIPGYLLFPGRWKNPARWSGVAFGISVAISNWVSWGHCKADPSCMDQGSAILFWLFFLIMSALGAAVVGFIVFRVEDLKLGVSIPRNLTLVVLLIGMFALVGSCAYFGSPDPSDGLGFGDNTLALTTEHSRT